MLPKKTIFLLTCLLGFNLIIFCQKTDSRQNDMMQLIEVEREFSKTAEVLGVSESFIKFFAPDGLNFQPQPIVISEAAKDNSAPPQPSKIIFTWEPIYADIAQSGELGYTTGPYEIRENTAEKKLLRTGFYFSVWKKQTDNSWKVLLDMGVGTPPLSSPEDKKLIIAPQVQLKTHLTKTETNVSTDAITQLEQKFSEISQNDGVHAYKKFGREDIRLHRFRKLPIIGAESVTAFILEKEAKSSWQNIKSGISASADFAWSYGTYKLIQENQTEDRTKEGYYLRVWRKDSENNWKIVAEITNPLKL